MTRVPFGEFNVEDVYPEIVPLIGVLRTDRRVVTLGSCWGHGRELAYIDMAVHGLPGLRHFITTVDAVDRAMGRETWFEISVNWSSEVATACDFDQFPDWVMLSWAIEGRGANGALSPSLLNRIAHLCAARADCGRPRPRGPGSATAADKGPKQRDED